MTFATDKAIVLLGRPLKTLQRFAFLDEVDKFVDASGSGHVLLNRLCTICEVSLEVKHLLLTGNFLTSVYPLLRGTHSGGATT